MKRIIARFYCNASGNEPVRDWLKNLSKEDKQIIGVDIQTIEFGWPIGMPTCKALGGGLYEVRSSLSSSKICRIIFCMNGNEMVLLHGFIKKTQKIPDNEIETARKRLKEIKNG